MKKFTITIDDSQEIDLQERADASKLTPAEMIERALYAELFQTPVVVIEEEEK